MSKRIALSLDPELVSALDSYVATRPGENRSTIAARALAQYLRKLRRKPEPQDAIDEVDIAMAREADRRMADPTDEFIPWEQAKVELGL